MRYHFVATLLFCSLSFVTQLHAQSQSALVDGAKKEGKLVWYTSMAVDTSKPLLDAFLKEYPFINAELVRAGEEQLVNRILSEIRAGRWGFDVLSNSSIETMIERKIIAPYLAPDREQFMDQFKDPQGYWTGVFVNNLVLAYNTKMLAAKDAPKTYEDLLHPKWKGQMLMDSTDYDWFGTLMTVWAGKDRQVHAATQTRSARAPRPRAHRATGAPAKCRWRAYNSRIERMNGTALRWTGSRPSTRSWSRSAALG
jgi:ABC-type thiamine transport system substrate-binding protein